MADDLPKVSTLNDRLTRGLCAAALNPGLGSALIFDLQPEQLHEAADVFAEMIAAACGEKVVRVILRSQESEDDLWGSFEISGNNEESPIAWRSGLLSPAVKEDSACLIVIPDLERINSTVARALVSTIGTDVANLERYGRHEAWRTRFYWLASCPGDAVGRISLHLLDRFALRLQARRPPRPDVRQLVEWLNRSEEKAISREAILPESLLQRVRTAAAVWPAMTNPALERVLKYESNAGGESPRRSFALSRLGHTLARLSGLGEVGAASIDEAARLLGVKVPLEDGPGRTSVPTDPDATSEASPAVPGKDIAPLNKPLEQRSAEPPIATAEEVQSKSLEQSVASSPVTELAAAALSGSLDPYPEDKQPHEREAASLRLPFQRSRQRDATRGTIVGTQPARTLHDLALVSTLLESAKFQVVRRKSLLKNDDHGVPDGRRILIAPSDLRGYRREPVPEQLLVLLVDFTCLQGRRWLESLLPYLKQAYVTRARICLIRVGAGTADHLLRADRQVFNSVLVPALASALESGAGKATPLAHGLDLALQTLKHALQHGRQTAHNAHFVVISDGRGNVPLTASITGKIEQPVSREGIEDALSVGRQFRALDRVDITLFDPQPSSHARLVADLAEALRTVPQEIPLLENELVEEKF